MIPHSVEGLSINRGENACLGCHASGMELGAGHVAVKIPPSHYLNEHTKEKRADQAAEAPPVRQMGG